jgi:predicted ABC-type ATPase
MGLQMSTVVIFAGPNGSGKSSIIAHQLTEGNSLPNLYICPDIIVAQKYQHIEDELERYRYAADEAEQLRYQAIEQGKSFIFETLASTPNKLEFLEYAKEKGYSIELIFVTTKDPQINIKRVNKRVNEGGHNVPTDKIVARYYKSMDLLKKFIEVSDSALIIDNTTTPIVVFIKDIEHGMIALNRELRNEWVTKYVLEPFKGKISSDLTVKQTESFINDLDSKIFSVMRRLNDIRLNKRIRINLGKKSPKKFER